MTTTDTSMPAPAKAPELLRRLREGLEEYTARARHQSAGGRWLVWAGRGVLWAVLLLVGVNGLRATFAPATPAAVAPSTPAAVAPVFPGEAAKAYAARFAADWLTFDEQAQDRRRQVLAGYGPAAGQGWNGAGHQTVATVVPGEVKPLGGQAAVVTVAAQVTSWKDGQPGAPRWVHLAIPLAADASGRLAITDTPAFVAAPPAAPSPPAASGEVKRDAPLEQALRAPLTGFFKAWASGSPAELSYYLAPATNLAGLKGAVGFDALEALTAPAGGPQRQVLARVRWRQGQALLTTTYRLDVIERESRWYVAAVDANPPTPLPDQP